MPVEPEQLAQVLSHLRARDFESTGVAVALQDVVDTTHRLFAVTGTGLMLVDDAQALRYVAASDDAGRILEVAQEEHGVGPCVDALVNDLVVPVGDIAADARYVKIAADVTPHGVRAVLGVPVHLGGSTVGSLNAYSNTPTEWVENDIDALKAITSVIENIIAGALLTERHSAVVEQLEFALQNRVTIERAVGVIMARNLTDAVTAFNILRASARSQRRKVADVAQELLDQLRDAS
jgi:GAF domain-containing protein